MPPDHVTGYQERAGAGRAGHAGACARAGLFAVLGTVLATFGHHAIAEGTVPWRLVGVLIAAQFAAVWPLARRRYAPVATVMATLAMQGLLHLALSATAGDASTAMPHAMHPGHMAAASGDGHAWHHAGAAMTIVHTFAALTVAWLLHRADVRMTAALGTLRTLAGAAAAALAQVLPRTPAEPDRALPRLPEARTNGFFAAKQAREEVLEHAVVRRGPPRERLPVLHRFRHLPDRILPYQQGVPLCPHPPTRWRAPAAVSLSPAQPR
ncbi:hypothetical protein [Streptomyces sp. STR69]|uniref:hypothetical protein n=1 Tax=Streptomyces sp. STR69 TaxID=1796942 RepID=UPI0021C8EB34|nr:hypothetical protein [Streptomyces sp. STR69]